MVLRRVKRNGFGREYMSDRIAEVWRDYHAFNQLPRHVRVRDLVFLDRAGELQSIAAAEELLLLTDFAPGTTYAEDLHRVGVTGRLTSLDRQRAQLLASYLGTIHTTRNDDLLIWRRRWRDLVGDGEGIMGLADSYAADDEIATPARLRRIEVAANEWRWRLKDKKGRLCQVHGDFHPYNILFDQGAEFTVLDRSRGEWGEAADDVSCLMINYLFFSLPVMGCLDGPYAELYELFWTRYLAERDDPELLAVIAPWISWRILVLASPQWYPASTPEVRHKLLNLADNVLSMPRFEWQAINEYLAAP
jgi:aminoglycoside phosphotransferase (APT) family kinase protein